MYIIFFPLGRMAYSGYFSEFPYLKKPLQFWFIFKVLSTKPGFPSDIAISV